MPKRRSDSADKVKKVHEYRRFLLLGGLGIVMIFGLLLMSGLDNNHLKTSQFIGQAPGDYTFYVEHQGMDRKYIVHVPRNYSISKKAPVVIALHGGGGNAQGSVEFFQMNNKADAEGFIVVYPEGTGKEIKGKIIGSWNAGDCCPSAMDNDIDDVGFIDKMLDDLISKFSIDERRIFATGHSNGALMAYRLACDLSERIAAIAPSGAQDATITCNSTRAVSVLHMHGTEDPCAPYKGGLCGGCFMSFINKLFGTDAKEYTWQCPSVQESIDGWKTKNECLSGSEITYQNGGATCTTNKCKDDSEVILCAIDGMGHAWPGRTEYGIEACKTNPGGYICKLWANTVGPLSSDIIANDYIWEFFKKHPMPMPIDVKPPIAVEPAPTCGNGLCSKDETKASCPRDCDEISCRDLYQTTENNCINDGWKKKIIDVDGIDREMLWKAPDNWKNGAIIAMHGGEGTHSMVCSPVPKEQNPLLSDILRGVPAAEFGELAVAEGFAVFSLNSTYNRATDADGLSIGKRWDSLKQDDKENIDLDFIETVIDETIPGLRPANSEKSIFMTGISNGGFMTTLASTHFSDKITAFAPVASGDPYGMYFDMSTKHLLKRACGPGTWRDLETNKEINKDNSCRSNTYPNEKEWPLMKRNIPFKQFYHQGDGGVHYSCMEKAQKFLINNGYQDDGTFVINTEYGKRSLQNHFWQWEYNQPILDFFKKYGTKATPIPTLLAPVPILYGDPCNSDVNHDGIVNWLDVWLLSRAINKGGYLEGYDLVWDVNQDGQVDSLDLEIVTNNKGLRCIR